MQSQFIITLPFFLVYIHIVKVRCNWVCKKGVVVVVRSAIMAAAAEWRLEKEAATVLVKDLRRGFSPGRMREYEWRTSQLRSLLVLLDECEAHIYEALRSNLNKPEFEAFLSEVSLTHAHTLYLSLNGGWCCH